MKKNILLITSLLSFFIIFTAIPVVNSEEKPWVVYGYVYLDNEVVIPDQLTLIISEEEYIARIYENGYYLIEFSPTEIGQTGSYIITISEDIWELQNLLIIQEEEYIFNKDLYLSSSEQLPNPPTINGATEGTINTEYTYTFQTTDPDNDKIKYAILWGDDSTILITDLLSSGTEYSNKHIWSEPGIYTIQANAKDESNQISETTEYKVLIDTHYVSYLGYLIDNDNNGIYDSFYSNSNDFFTDVLQKNDGYVIDTDMDYIWDYEYNPNTGMLVEINPEQTEGKGQLPEKTSSENQFILIFGLVFFLGAITVLILAFYLKNQKTTVKESYIDKEIKPVEKTIEKPVFEPRQIQPRNISHKIDNLIANQVVKEEKKTQIPELNEIEQHIDQLKKRDGSAGI